MTELLLSITELPIADIILAKKRLRPVTEPGVQALLHVIAAFGFTTPVIVRRAKKGFVLIDGAHRIEAATRLGMTVIPVRAYVCSDDEAQAMEAGQNIAGADMSPLDDALFLVAYQSAYERLHPETRRGAASTLARQGLQSELSSFCDVIAEKRSISPRQVQKIVAAGRLINQHEVEQLRSAPRKVTLKDIEDIGKIGRAEERSAVVLRLSVGNAKSAADARRSLKAEAGGQAPVKDPVELQFMGMVAPWSRCTKAARRRFVAQYFGELSELVAEEAAAMEGAAA